MSVRPCPECHGARLRPESLAVKLGGLGIHELTHMSARRTIEWFDALELTDTERADRAADPARDRRAAALPGQRGRGLPVAGARGGHAVGRRGPADPPGHPDRLEPGRRALHPRRALDRPAPARQRAADRHPGAPARPGQHGDRGRARRGHHARRRPPRGPGPRRGRARRRRRGPGHRRGDREDPGLAHRPVPVRGRGDPDPAQAAPPGRLPGDRGRRPAQPPARERQDPAGHVQRRHRRVRVGQVHAGQRGALQGRGQPAAPGQDAPGRAQAHRGAGPDRQDHQHRPVADRAHAAVQPGHLHRRVRRHPRPLLTHPGGAGARLQAGPLLLQRQGRALRGLPRRRPDQDRDALPARRLRAVRAVRRQALQPRDAGGALQGQDDRRRAGHDGRGGGRLLPAHPQDHAASCRRCTTWAWTTSAWASRPPRCRAARPSA